MTTDAPMPAHVDRFLVDREAAGLAARTLDWYAGHLRQAADWFAQAGDPADPDLIRAFLAERRRQTSPAAAGAHYRALKAFWNWLEEEGEIAVSPMARIRRPKEPRKEPRRASYDDYERLLESIPRETWLDLRDRLIVMILYLAGVRVAELCALSVDDVDMPARLLHITGKGSRDRTIPIWPAVVPALLEYLLQRPASDCPALLYAGDGSGGHRGRLTPSGVRQRLRTLCNRAGIDYLNPHSFRHGLAIWLLNSGQADMSVIQKMLGHSQIATTQAHYADWITDGLQRAYNEAIERATRNR